MFTTWNLKPIMRSAKSYIRDTSDFLKRLEELGGVPQNALLVAADMVGLYPNITHQDGLDTLSLNLDQRDDKIISTEDQQQVWGTATGT